MKIAVSGDIDLFRSWPALRAKTGWSNRDAFAIDMDSVLSRLALAKQIVVFFRW